MNSRRIQSDTSNVSLFPFLAVLLCTMGTLIVILVVMTKQVRAKAQSEMEAKAVVPDELAKEVKIEEENLQWQIENLEESLAATAETLQNDRLKLSHTEAAIVELQKKIEQLDAAARELDKASDITAEQRQAAEADLARLRNRLTEVAADLDKARKEAANRPPSYSIIPYEGPNQTRRQPVFIECTSEAVILQPEGIKLGAQDFEEPLGPGNPLAAALRATREHIVHSRRAAGLPEQEPYPLIVVRPSGIAAYYGVRDAIKSWDADFGYELIGEDWKLSFPMPDPTLAEVQRQAVESGRRYQARLAASAPSMYGRRQPVYRAAPHRGGLIREDGGGGRGGAHGGNAGRSAPDRDRGTDSFANSSDPVKAGRQASQSQNGKGEEAANPNVSGGQPGGQNAASSATAQANNGFGGTTAQKQQGFENNGTARAKNWALPDANSQSVPITRTVRVLCRDDRLVIMPERGLEGGQVILLDARTEDSLEEFVSKMWEHMKGWGIAGSGLYWRPVLALQVIDGGEQRAKELTLLLENSGVEVKDATAQ